MTTFSIGLGLEPQPFRLLELPPEVAALLDRAADEPSPTEADIAMDAEPAPITYAPVGPSRVINGRRRYPMYAFSNPDSPTNPASDTNLSYSLHIKSASASASAHHPGTGAAPFAALCSTHSTYQLRQIQTSNSLFIAKAQSSTETTTSPTPTSHLSLLGQCHSTLELKPTSNAAAVVSIPDPSVDTSSRDFPTPMKPIPGSDAADAVSFIQAHCPAWFPDDDADGDDPMIDTDSTDDQSTHLDGSSFVDIPFSDLECRTAATVLLAFTPPSQSPPTTTTTTLHLPSPRDQLTAWETIVEATLCEGIDITSSSAQSWSRAPVTEAYHILFASSQTRPTTTLPLPLFGALMTRLKIPIERFGCYQPSQLLTKARLKVPHTPGPSDSASDTPIDGITTSAYIGILLLYRLTACPISSSSSAARDSGIALSSFVDQWSALLPAQWHFLTRLTEPADPSTTSSTTLTNLPALVAPFCVDVGPPGPDRFVAFRSWSDTPSSALLTTSGGGEGRTLGLKHMFPHLPSSPALLKSNSHGVIPSISASSSASAGGGGGGGSGTSAAAAGGANKRKWHDLLVRDRRR